MLTEEQRKWLEFLGIDAPLLAVAGPVLEVGASLGEIAKHLAAPVSALGAGGAPSAAPAKAGKPGEGHLSLDEGATIEKQGLGPAVFGPNANMLYALLDDAGSGRIQTPAGAKLNSDGIGILKEFEGYTKAQLLWNNKIGGLEKDAGKGLTELKQLQDAGAAIGDHAGGPAGKYLRDAIEAYLESIRTAQSKMRDIGSKFKGVTIANDDINTTSLRKTEKDQQREKTKQEGDVQAEQKKIDDLKNRAQVFVGIAASLIKPDAWMSLAVTAVACVGEDMLEENIPTSHLEDLQKKLAETTANLAATEDAIILSQAAADGEKLQKATLELDNTRQDFIDFSANVRLKEATVVEAMKSSQPAAAKAIANRGKVIKDADEAQKMIEQYLKDTAAFPHEIQLLAERYTGYIMIVAEKVGNAPYMASLADTCRENAATLGEFKEYIDDMRALGHNGLAFLAKSDGNTYFAGYDKIPDVLQAALEGRLDNLKVPKGPP